MDIRTTLRAGAALGVIAETAFLTGCVPVSPEDQRAIKQEAQLIDEMRRDGLVIQRNPWDNIEFKRQGDFREKRLDEAHLELTSRRLENLDDHPLTANLGTLAGIVVGGVAAGSLLFAILAGAAHLGRKAGSR